MLSTGDSAGSGYKIKQAVHKVSKNHNIITVFKKKHKYGYKSDYILNDDNKFYIQKLIDNCDIIHFKGDELPVENWNGLIIPEDKKIIITVGGSGFRRNETEKPKKIAQNWHSLESYILKTDLRTCITPDLNYVNFESHYTPHAIDVNSAKYTWKIKEKIIIQHSPSNRKKKGTDTIILPALYELKDEGFDFEIELLENLTNKECIKLKKNGNIFIDQICETGFYGMSTLESIQFGIPTIAYISEKSIKQSDDIINKEDCKIISVKNKNELKNNIKFLLNNIDYLKQLSIDTKTYASKVHSFESVGSLWVKLYNKILNLNIKNKKIESYIFKKNKNKKIYSKNYKIVFSLNFNQKNIKNLEFIVPNILKQCDFLYINTINYNLSKNKYSFLNNDKVIINKFSKNNFETLFSHFNNHGDEVYYFPISDELKYPYDYSDVMIKEMNNYNNECICSGNGYDKFGNFYDVFQKNDKEIQGFIPNILTSCFFVNNFEINKDILQNLNLIHQYDFFPNDNSVKSVLIKKIKYWLKNF